MMTSLPASIPTLPTRNYMIAAQYADSLSPYRQYIQGTPLGVGPNQADQKVDKGELQLASQVLQGAIQYYSAYGFAEDPTVKGWQNILDATNVMQQNFTTFLGNGMPTITPDTGDNRSFEFNRIYTIANQTNDGISFGQRNDTFLSQQDLNATVIPM
ncbi:MAG: hypothetical protein ACKO37_02300 [Vampirovibrionales bacterium]